MREIHVFRRSNALILPILFVITGAVSDVYADFNCGSEISFKWKKEGSEDAVEVPWGKVNAQGPDEAQAKTKLGESVLKQRQRAAEYCHRQHENLTGCVSVKYAANTSTLKSLDFSARKALEEAINSDCKSSQGVCAETTASEPTCAEVIVATDKKADEAAGKDDKAAKKKK